MFWKLRTITSWFIVIGTLVLAITVIWFVQLRQNQREASLRSLEANSFIEPTLPPFIIDRTSTVPLATSSTKKLLSTASASSLLAQSASTSMASTSTLTVALEALRTPVSIEPLAVTASVSIPYIRNSDLVINQDGTERRVVLGRIATATQSAISYAYPQVSPNGTLVAFFELIEPIKLGDLITAKQVALKVLDGTTGSIRTTPYRFPQLRHDLDGGLPVRWNSRNFLEIEQQSTALQAAHILYDPDRNVVLAENNLQTIPYTPWKDRTAISVLPGFTISPDGQWRVTTNQQQFLLHPVGSDKVLPVAISEIATGHLVRFYGWFFGHAYFEVEKQEYQSCLRKASQLTTSQRSSTISSCFLDTHYLLAVDPATQQIVRRWYNYQLGQHQDLRWVRLTWFLDQAVLNHKNEIIYLQPKVPLVYDARLSLQATTSPSGRVAVLISKDTIEVWRHDESRQTVTLNSPLTMQNILASSYRFMWAGNERYVLLYPNDYARTAEASIILIDLQSLQATRITELGRSLPML